MPRHTPVKAYKNTAFVESRDARMLRIMAEYMETEKRLREFGIEDTIVFFGSARTLSYEDAQSQLADLKKSKKSSAKEIAKAERDVEMSHYYEAARDLAGRLTKWARELADEKHDSRQRFSIVTGGGPGIMEAANRGAEEAGGSTIGMNISLPFEQYPNEHISDGLAFEFHYFFVRKFWLVYLAKAAIIMPGGYGTLDEFMEILTLVQTEKINRKFPIVLFGSKFWEKVIDFSQMAEFGTINPDDLDLFYITDSVEEAFEWLKKELMEWAVDNPGGGFTTTAEEV
jgi:hypothetical protein